MQIMSYEGLGDCYQLKNDHALCPATTIVREFDPFNQKMTTFLDKMISKHLSFTQLFYTPESGYFLIGHARYINEQELMVQKFDYQRYLEDSLKGGQ